MYRQISKLFVILFIGIASVILAVDYIYGQIEHRNMMERDVGSFWKALAGPVKSNTINIDEVYQLVRIEQLAWPEEKVKELKYKGYLLLEVAENTYLFHGYFAEKDSVLITEVKMAPYSNSQWVWWLIIYGALAAVILWWLFPLIRDVKKLQDAAIEFGKSKTYNPVSVTEQSAVFPISDALSQMTNRIHRLMSLQRDISTYALHDIKTPLSRIRFACELINDPDSQELKKDITEEIDEVETLLTELLKYAEFEYTKPSMNVNLVNLRELCEQVRLKFSAISAIEIHNQVDPTIQVNLEYKLFKRALMNLISNSLRYAESGIWISYAYEKNWVCVVVEDDGPGIDTDALDYIKTPFMRKTNSEDCNSDESNSGLGLAIVETICLWHGGIFKVGNSEDYGGARFVMQWKSSELKIIR